MDSGPGEIFLCSHAYLICGNSCGLSSDWAGGCFWIHDYCQCGHDCAQLQSYDGRGDCGTDLADCGDLWASLGIYSGVYQQYYDQWV